jgi:hypothetical protein
MESYIPFEHIQLIDEEDIGSVIYRLYEGRIFHVIIKKKEKITIKMTEKGYDFLNRNGGGRFYNIYEFSSFSEMDPEVREWCATTSGNNYTYVDAIVISNFAQKLIADFYLKFNKPPMPTKIFKSKEKALDWILELNSE